MAGFCNQMCIRKVTAAARALPVLALSGVVGLSSACVSTGPWMQQTGDLPLASPGQQAREYCRVVEPGILIVAGATSDCVWETAGGERRDKWSYGKDFKRMLEKTGLWETFPETGSSEGKCYVRVAPYRFTLVAIDPSVIVATPQDHPEVGSQDFYRFRFASGGLDIDCLENSLLTGPVAPFAAGAGWLSPDLGGGLQEIEWEGASARLRFDKGGGLRFERIDDEIVATRFD